ncbi:hypothetical protein [Microbacterium sp. NPDC058389]|uniref:hypothetical protein n=1 Tax=Microbacterium sp. NPDC058389 TaxID=3346475 RepID=UPI0036577F0E
MPRPSADTAHAGTTGGGRTRADGIIRALAGAVVPVLVLAVWAATMVAAGVPALDLARYAGYLAFGVVAPGFVLHRALRGPQRSWLAEVVYGSATAVLAGIAVWAAASVLGLREWLWAWPVAAGALIVVPAVRRRVFARPSGTLGPLASVGIAAAAVATVLTQRVFFASAPYPPSDRPYYADLLWHMSLASEAMRSFPLQTPQVATSGPIRYHWFTHADIALTSMMSGVDVPALVLRLWPVALTLLVIGIVAVLAVDLSGRRTAGALAALITAAPVILTPWMSQLAYQDLFRAISPTQIYSYVPLLMALSAVASLVRAAPARAAGPIVLLVVSVMVGAGAKPTVLPLLAAAGVVGLVAAVVLRQRWLPFGLLLAVIVPAYVVSASWTSGSQTGSRPSLFALATLAGFVRERLPADALSSDGLIIPGMFDGARLTAAVILTACIIVLRPLLGLAPLFQRELRADSVAWSLSGVCGAGVAGGLLIGHPGYSQLYFVQAAAPVGAVMGAWWITAAVGTDTRRRTVAVAAALVGAATAVAVVALWPAEWTTSGATVDSLAVTALALVAAGLVLTVAAIARRTRPVAKLAGVAVLGALVGTIVVSAGFGWTTAGANAAADARVRDEYEAASWIAHNTAPDALLAVNDHCVGAESADCDARVFWVSGLGGRRVLIEGWAYDGLSANAYPVGAVHPPYDAELLTFNQSLFEAPTAESMRQAAERGLDYLVATSGETEVSPGLREFADPVFQNDSVTIYRLR